MNFGPMLLVALAFTSVATSLPAQRGVQLKSSWTSDQDRQKANQIEKRQLAIPFTAQLSAMDQ
jgi:hypothetical protein